MGGGRGGGNCVGGVRRARRSFRSAALPDAGGPRARARIRDARRAGLLAQAEAGHRVASRMNLSRATWPLLALATVLVDSILLFAPGAGIHGQVDDDRLPAHEYFPSSAAAA